MKSWIKTLVIIVFIAVLYFNSSRVLAQGVNDFVISSFDADYELSNDDPQGKLYITENIELVFSGQNQGIERAVPTKYKDIDHKLKVVSTKRDGKAEPFSTYMSNDNQVIRIGVRGVFITGAHNYEIEYEVSNVISFYENHDELYWDINGDEWLQTFSRVTADITTDAPIKESVAPECFTGSFGSQSKNCKIDQIAGTMHVETIAELTPNQTLTIVQSYNKNYFKSPSLIEKNRHLLFAVPFFIAIAITVRYSYKKWNKLGKDYKKRGVIAPYFERPKGLSVMQASYVESNNLTPQHMSASMIDLAIRGYIQIVEVKKTFSTKHQLVLKNTNLKGLSLDEQELLKALFSNFSVGQEITIESLKNKLYTTATSLKKQIDSMMTVKGYYELSPQNSAKVLVLPLVISIVTLILSVITAGITKWFGVGFSVFGLISVIVLMSLMAKRSPEGNMLVEHMQGLKQYLSFSEKDRINSLDAVSAPLSMGSGEPVRDVKFFEKLLPFAIALGVEKSWADSFKDIYTNPPDWYRGNWNTFSTAALVSSLSSTSAATANSFTAPTSSGGSGSGGGGFSGGGGGGGGGGGW